MIDVRGVTLTVGQRILLRDLTFTIEPGEFVAVLGANGVGKTTLLRALAGLRRPAAGTIRIDGHKLDSLTVAQRAHAIAYVVSDDLFEEHLTVRDVVATGRYAHHR